MKILIVQTSFIGDTILSSPVISGLKRIYPDSGISIMINPAASGLFKKDPLIEEEIVFDKRGRERGISGLVEKALEIRKKGFSKVYSLHRSFRTSFLLYLSRIPERVGFSDTKFGFLYTRKIKRVIKKHAVVSNLSLLSGDIERKAIDYELRLFEPGFDELGIEAKRSMSSLSGKYAVLAPGSAWKTKQWHWKGFAQTAEFLVKKGLDVVLIGGKDDIDVCGKISRNLDIKDLSGKIPLSDTLYVVKKSCLLICNDSMALHMSSAFKIPAVVVFCATSPLFGFGPWRNPEALVVEDDSLECKPCRRHGSMKCPDNTYTCVKVSSEIVVQACIRLLGWK